MRTSVGTEQEFLIMAGVHHGFTISHFFFKIIMDKLTRPIQIQDTTQGCLIFSDKILLIDEAKEDVKNKLKLWRQTLKARDFILSRSITEYLVFNFSKIKREI